MVLTSSPGQKQSSQLPGECYGDYSSDIQPLSVQGAQKGWRCFPNTHRLPGYHVQQCLIQKLPLFSFSVCDLQWLCVNKVIRCTAVQGHAVALPCPQRVSYLQCMVVINGSDPVLVLVKQPSPLCSPVRAGRASFKLQRKKGKIWIDRHQKQR